jgi:hypothetical protein
VRGAPPRQAKPKAPPEAVGIFLLKNGVSASPAMKSGTNVKAKSLELFREAYRPKISIRFSLKNARLDNDLQNISLFGIFLCEQLLDYSCEKCVK